MILRNGQSPSSGPPGGSDCATRCGAANTAPVLSDDELEACIESARVAMTNASTRDEVIVHWVLMRALISMRSPDRVAEMERQRGLR